MGGIDTISMSGFMNSGVTGLFYIVVEVLSIVFVWSLLQEVKWDKLFRFPRNAKARMFQVILAIVIGHSFAQFILQYWGYTVLLRGFAE